MALHKLEDLLDAARKTDPMWQAGSVSPAARDNIRGVPVNRITDSFENFDLSLNPGMREAFAQCERVARREDWSAFLCGSYGTGKTHLAIAALSLWDNFSTGRFWKVPDFLRWIKRRAYDEQEPIDSVLDPYRTRNTLIVFDDLGAENQTDWAGEQLYSVLDSRYDSRLPTIITSNVSPQKLDGRIVSRFRSGLVVCSGVDIRARR